MIEYDYLIKIIILGESGVGKSSILSMYCDDLFHENYISTIGVDFKIKQLNIQNKIVKLQIWDTAGQERFRTVTSSYYRGARAVFLVFDLSDVQTFINLTKWLNDIKHYVGQNICKIILLGNKSDIFPQAVSQKDINEFALQYNLDYIPVSAKNNVNLEAAFNKIAKDVICDMLVSDLETKYRCDYQLQDPPSRKQCCK